ncbi:MAG: SseB family protein [Geodermatophilaceae bacterium]|nr:SseB family protein [Geodermatophilaceae bacterium]
MQPWQPANSFEEQLLAAHVAEDTASCLGLLRMTELALPISAAAAAGEEPPRWATADREDGTWLLAYTSVESMGAGTDGLATHSRLSSLVELAAGWPDLSWGLAVNPGLPLQLLLTSGMIALLAAPTLADEQAAHPGRQPPLVQKVLPHGDLSAMFARRDNRVSGYVQLLADVDHIGSPNVLLDALGRSAEERQLIDDAGSVFLLRWPVIGPELYRNPFGGTTERSRAAVGGWVIEEPPFIGTGFVPNVDQVIREFKVDGIGLPHRSEIIELDIEGVERRRAVWDGDRGTWMLALPSPPGDRELA